MRRFGVFIITVLFAASMLHAQTTPTGPSIGGSVYGGGRMAPVDGNAKIQMKGGAITESIFGGNDIAGHTGNGSNSFAAVTGATSTQLTNGEFYGVIVSGGTVQNVYGGANGYYACHEAETTAVNGFASIAYKGDNFSTEDVSGKKIPAINNASVLIAGGTITGSVYGGGNLAPIGYDGIDKGSSGYGSVSVKIQQGTINGNVFGGGNMACVYVPVDLIVNNKIGSTFPDLTIVGGVYGGNDKSGNVLAKRYDYEKISSAGSQIPQYSTYVLIQGTPTIGGVYGAGNGAYSDYDARGDYNGLCELKRPHQATGTLVDINTEGGYIDIVCGGGNLANVEKQGDRLKTSVLLNATGTGAGEGNRHVGSIYGAGYGDKDNLDLAVVSGNVEVKVIGGSVGNVFGGGCMASVEGYTNVYVQGGTIGNVYGGNDITGTVSGANNPIHRVSDNSFVTTASFVQVSGSPTVGQVFGGGNGDYDYTQEGDGSGRKHYAGLNPPVIASTFVDLNMAGGKVTTAFAGGNNATVSGNASVLLNTTETINTENLVALVGSIFGGNNKAAMGILPNINLNKGVVENVYGGGNMGAMTGSASIASRKSGDNEQASTYVLVNSGDVYVTNNLYGGCNQAPVSAAAYVDVRAGHVNNLYGGNDIGAAVQKTRIDVSGGQIQNIFGGSNGFYEYIATGSGVYNVKEFGGSEDIAEGVALPVCTTTNVNIWGGTFGTENKPCNIYAGGKAGDCDNTYLNINDQELAATGYDATVNGKIFGGGMGIQNCNPTTANPRVGNVTGIATSNLYHLTNLNDAVVYGGGDAGDVHETKLTIKNTWDEPFKSIYGGCRAADVVTANTTIEELPHAADSPLTSGLVFGGNDVAGTVQNTYLTINGGVFDTIFGGGNGEYVYCADQAAYEASSATNKVLGCGAPYSEKVTVVINNGRFNSNIYGGGNLGIVGKKATAVADYPAGFNIDAQTPDSYGWISLNVHGGEFLSNIFTGGRGDQAHKDADPLFQVVYGLKQLNMDGGHVARSVYGGSEYVNDGYPAECGQHTVTPATSGTPATEETPAIPATPATVTYSNDNITTLRPSSIVNIVGGTIVNNVYGGGYLGLIHGSVYVNIGKEAVKKSPVWTMKHYQTTEPTGDITYAAFNYKPRIIDEETTTEANQLHPSDLYLEKSIYNGSDWGDGEGMYEFNLAGFHGGESRILFDGQGYNSAFVSSGSDMPAININENFVGSGTSCEGGDQGRYITIRNYGEYLCGGNLPAASKAIKSIQRADHVLIDNSNIELTGTQDLYSAYASSNYSFCRISDLVMQGGNFVSIAAPTKNISMLTFNKADGTVCQNVTADLNTMYRLSSGEGTAACEDNTLCDRIVTGMNPYTKLYIKDGVYFDIVDVSGTTPRYGELKGYAYVMVAEGTEATITARKKDGATNPNDGGFFSVCKYDNKYPLGVVGQSYYELNYTNYTANYRTWTFGTQAPVVRKRQVTLVAHSNTEILESNVNIGSTPLSGGENPEMYNQFAYAKSTLQLPPTAAGHFYRIKGIQVDMSNGGQLILNEETYDPTYDPTTNPPSPRWFSSESSGNQNYKRVYIKNDPTYNFGLMFQTNPNTFNNGQPISQISGESTRDKCLVFGNDNYSALDGYLSPTVKDANNSVNVFPEMDFYLTYSKEFSTTILRDIVFILDEKYLENTGTEEEPVWVERSVGDVEVTVTISTVVETFKDDEFNVMAMYNGGITNKFTHKVLLPATLRTRDLYLTEVEWKENTELEWPEGTSDAAKDLFNLTDKVTDADITALADSVAQKSFGMTLEISRELSSSVNSSLDWNSVNTPLTNVFTLMNNANSKNQTIDLGSNPVYLGKLDGRAPAAMNFNLWYNGNVVFPGHTPVDASIGTVKFTFKYIDAGREGTFEIVCNVKTRERGDTIYIASANQITRAGCTVKAWEQRTQEERNSLSNVLPGKRPMYYVQSFKYALSPANKIYTDGDVICIIDTVKMGFDQNEVVRGGEFGMLQVIRYSGRHVDLPGEQCAYKGPMMQLNRNSRFTCYNMRFDGSGICKVMQGGSESETLGNICSTAGTNTLPADGKHYYENSPRVDAVLYSNAPIFVVRDNATLTFADQVEVLHNFNTGTPYYEAVSTTTPIVSADTIMRKFNGGGAIAAIGGYTYTGQTGWNRTQTPVTAVTTTGLKAAPQVNLNNNVTIHQNIIAQKTNSSSTVEGYKTNNGAGIFVNQALVVVNSPEGALVTIESNYFANDANGFVTSDYKWNVPDDAKKNNVYLTRIADNNLDMKDAVSDHVTFLSTMDPSTRIGITKTFPGETVRDTINIAYLGASNPTYAMTVYNNHNFFSDLGTNTFYHTTISPTLIYLHRCATFQEQNITSSDPLYAAVGTTPAISQKSVLEYGFNRDASCPNEPDTLKYSLHGGFYPYTFTWREGTSAEGTLLDKITSPYANDVVVKDATHAKALESNTGKYPLTNMTSMSVAENEETYNYYFTATDLAGCTKEHKATIKVVKNPSATYTDTWLDYQGETSHEYDTIPNYRTRQFGTVSSTEGYNPRVLRLYKGVHVEASVQPDADWASISSKINGTDVTITSGNENAFCVGHTIDLNTTAAEGQSYSFVMWDFDPNASAQTQYVITEGGNNTIHAVYANKSDYWTANVTTNPGVDHFELDYGGNAHVKSANGLAWLISVVNGLNGQQARSFVFDTVFIEATEDLDMSAHLWTPIGTPNNPFRGRFYVKKNVDGYTEHEGASSPLKITGITVNEPDMLRVGFFGLIDTARVKGLVLENVVVRGAQYGGAVAGEASKVVLEDCSVLGGDKSIITANYAVGGLVGRTSNSTIGTTAAGTSATVNARLVGNTIFCGGVAGSANGDNISNQNVTDVKKDVTTIYDGGIAGNINGDENVCKYEIRDREDTEGQAWFDITNDQIQMIEKDNMKNPISIEYNLCAGKCPYEYDETRRLDGSEAIGYWIDVRDNSVYRNPNGGPESNPEANPCASWSNPYALPAPAKTVPRNAVLMNNLVGAPAPKHALYYGGLVGSATNTRMENNYAYGNVKATVSAGALVGVANEGNLINECYYLEGIADQAVGTLNPDNTVKRVHKFNGNGNQVVIDSTNVVNNLTRRLNRWVRKHQGEGFLTWRSAQGNENSGYPVFGEPDFIPVHDTMNRTICDFYSWNGTDYTETGVYSQTFHDTVEYIDSTMTLFLTINESMLTELADSALISEDYFGNGFFVSSTELELLRSTVEEFGSAMLLVADTLSTEHGCDSIVELHLTVFQKNVGVDPAQWSDVKVYPNPTTSFVNVRADNMTEVELYDNVSRKLKHQKAAQEGCQIDLSGLPSGYYYLRIHTSRGVVIKKIVKK